MASPTKTLRTPENGLSVDPGCQCVLERKTAHPCGERPLVLLSGQPGGANSPLGQGLGRVSPLPWPALLSARSIHP